MVMVEKKNFMKKLDADKIIFIITNIITLAIMYYLSLHTPLYSDDIAHSTIDGTMPITNMTDIFTSTRIYYQTWGGRVISRLIFQYLIAFNKPLYNILNAAMYVIYANIIQWYIVFPLKIKRSNFSLILTYLMLWLFTPSFGGSYLWLTGSVTYLWLMVPILGFGFLYYRKWINICQKNDKLFGKECEIMKIGKMLAMFLLGLVAGWSIEAAMCVLLLGLLLFIFYMFKVKVKIAIHEWSGILGFIMGAGFLMLAPGNYTRADTVTESANLFVRYGFRIARETYYACQYMLIPFGIAISLLIWNHMESQIDMHNKGKWEKIFFPVKSWPASLMLILSVVSIYVMTFSAVFANRIFITPLALNIIALNMMLLKFIGCDSEKVSMEEERETLKKHFYKRQCASVFLLTVLILYCTVQMMTAVLICSRNDIPIEKYVTYKASEVENGVW